MQVRTETNLHHLVLKHFRQHAAEPDVIKTRGGQRRAFASDAGFRDPHCAREQTIAYSLFWRLSGT
jgi:hypothetical protein